jgi:hypothetical protein
VGGFVSAQGSRDTAQDRMTSDAALKQAVDWAEGRRSWVNLYDGYGDSPGVRYPHDVIAVMDAQEVVKWSALAAALAQVEAVRPVLDSEEKGDG